MDSAAEIFRLVRPDTELVAIDEAQFLDPRHRRRWPRALAARGVRVILAGTDTDFRGEPFGAMGDLMAVAEMVDKLQRHLRRLRRSRPAATSGWSTASPARYDSPTIMVGGRESLRGALPALPPGAAADEDQTAFSSETAHVLLLARRQLART